MQKYIGIFQNYFASSLEYRSNLVGVVLSRLVSMGVIVVLWIAVYTTEQEIGGYNLSEVMVYYVLVPFIGVITSVKLSEQLGFEIKDGLISSHLLKPYKLWIGSFARTFAEKVFTLSILGPLYLFILLLVIMFLGDNPLSTLGIFIGLLIAVFGYFLHFSLDLGISWLAFWMDDVWSFKHFKQVVFGVLGGVSFPFEFLPEGLRWLFNFLPFKYLYYVPIAYFVGQRPYNFVIPDIISIIAWLLLFSLIATLLWRKGVHRYGAYGG